MPHYADGTPAKHGDAVISAPNYEGAFEMLGIILSIAPGSTSCNAQIESLAMRQKGVEHWTPVRGNGNPCVTLSDCRKL